MKKIKLFSMLAALMLSVSMWAQGPWTSGDCTITLNGNVLTVSGSGATGSYTELHSREWFNYRHLITSIVVQEGVTEIKNYVFYEMFHVASVTLPSTLTKIGLNAFGGCINLVEVELKSTPDISDSSTKGAFNGCPNLAAIWCPTQATPFGQEAEGIMSFYPLLYRKSDHKHPRFSGSCGTDLTWLFYSDGEIDGKLDIYGSGDMEDYLLFAPWHKLTPYVKHLRLDVYQTSIGDNAFAYCENLHTVMVPFSITKIGEDAFFGCTGITSLYMATEAEDLTWYDDDILPDFAPNKATRCYLTTPKLYNDYRGKFGSYMNVTFTMDLSDGYTDETLLASLEALNNVEVPDLSITRPLVRNNYFNTLCLPFNMTPAEIANSTLADAEIKIFTGASIVGGVLNIEFSPIDHIEAGVPYFVRYSMADALTGLDFENVTIRNVNPSDYAITYNDITMKGTFVSVEVPGQDAFDANNGVLFLGSNNHLYWPEVAGKISPFRAFFELKTSGTSGAPRRGMPVKIVERENAPTAIESIQKDVQLNKTIENGMLIIEKNGVRYNAQGQIVK